MFDNCEFETDSIAPALEFKPTQPQQQPAPPTPPPSPLPGAGDCFQVLVPRQQLVVMQKYYAAVKDAYFAFGQTDGDAEQVVRRLFDLTTEVLAVAGGQTPPIAAAIGRRGWRAAGRLLALAEARNPRALQHRTPAGEDALTQALGVADAEGSEANAEAQEAVLRRLVRQLAASPDGGGFGCDRRGRNALHAAAVAAAATAGGGGSPRLLTMVLEELDAQLGLLPPPAAAELRDRLTEALNAPDAAGCSPLHRMALGNLVEGARTLAALARRRGLRPDWAAPQAGGRGLSPLAMAAEVDALEFCELLLSDGLDSLDALLRDPSQRAMWLRAAPSESASRLLGSRCRRLLEPLAGMSADVRRQLADELRARRLEKKFLAELGDLLDGCCPPASLATELVTVLDRLDQSSGVARLAVWDILQRLGEPRLARLLEVTTDGGDGVKEP